MAGSDPAMFLPPLEVEVFDTTAEPLKRLFDYLVTGPDRGLWLRPYKGIPVMQGAKTFVLIYLDENCRVAERLDKYPNPQYTVLKDEPASALLLPAHTVFASQIRIGDQLAVSGNAEPDGMLTAPSDSTAGYSSTQAPMVADPSSSNSGSSRIPQQASIEQPKNKFWFGERVKRWFSTESQSGRRSNRHPLPRLIAYHWSGGTPQPYALGDISATGFYLLTDDRPYPGTLVMMTLQRIDTNGERLQDSVAVHTKVVRWGQDGVGFAFLAAEAARKTDHQPGHLADQETLNVFLNRASAREQ